ncbi:MAG: hypothetical protein OEV59_04620 [Deltaproteobacteria bacterium]|nr:hypothetical protein [Deltaproteobacteria bacterium]
MPKNELDIIAKSRIKQHRMVSSANIVEGYIAEINGIIFWMTFDKDERIDKIVIEDPKFRLKSGVAIGDNFSKIKSTYKNYYVVPLVGYGRMVFVEREGIVFGFPWREDDNVTIDDLDKIEWVEFVKTAF